MPKVIARSLHAALALFLLYGTVWANSVLAGTGSFDDYFKAETAKIAAGSLSNVQTLADWKTRRPELQREAAEMLGLDPMPERTPLHAVVTGKLEGKDFTVEKLYFESRPHLYVTANLYLPKPLTNPAPTVLYVCGHLAVISNGVSCGNKTAYRHHGIWFARNGYVCMIIDTLELGEIQGHHRGTYDEGQWWWNSRGYTPAGVETWNAIRALDYLDSRPEADTNRIGVTGRSGGGAYSWFLAAVDDRVKVIAPVAGITDLQNYVVDGAVDQHCDCMFLVNRYRWDYPLLASLCAPRPLMLGNSDADQLFPLDGVMRTRNAVKKVYDFYGASTNFAIVIGPGPHKDTQELQVPVFRWFNHYLKHEDPVIDMAAVKMFSPLDLRVFDKLPADQINTAIEDSFVPPAPAPEIPATAQAWNELKESWTNELRAKCFAGWPTDAGPPQIKQLFSETTHGIQCEVYKIQSQPHVTLRMYLLRKADTRPTEIHLSVADASFTAPFTEDGHLTKELVQTAFEIKGRNIAEVVFFPRATTSNIGTTNLTQLRRRFMLLGQTLDGMRVWDICRAVESVHSLDKLRNVPIQLEAKGDMGVNALYASLFVSGISSLALRQIPASQKNGPDYLNVLKVLDIPEAAAMAAERCNLDLQPDQSTGWDFLNAMAASSSAHLKLNWAK